MNKKLKEAVEFSKNLSEVEDSPFKAEKLNLNSDLYEETQNILSNKVKALCGKNYQVRYMGIKGSTFDWMGCSKKLADLINEACEAYQVIGILGEPMKIDLIVEDLEPKSLYVCYLAFSHEAAKVIDELIRLKAKTAFFQEGGIPETEVRPQPIAPERK